MTKSAAEPVATHTHECPHCGKIYGCACGGCYHELGGADDWQFKVCPPCFKFRHKKVGQKGEAPEADAEAKEE